MAKQKLVLEKSYLTQAARDKTIKALSQTTEQLDWVRATVAKHTADIAHIEALFKDCESMDEESSSSGESSSLEPWSWDTPAATPQGQEVEEHNIKMRDVENDPNLPSWGQGDNLPPVLATQTDPPPEDNADNSRSDQDVIIEDERIVIETGGATPITLADD